MEQKPLNENPGDAQKQPEIVVNPPLKESTEPVQNKICPACGTVNPPAAVYCFKCGLKLPDAAIMDKKICAGCNTPNSATSQYCYKCGLPLPDKLISSYENQIRYAGFWIRLAAFLLNGIIVSGLAFIVTIIVVSTRFNAEQLNSINTTLRATGEVSGDTLWMTLVFFITLLIVTIIYSTVCIGVWGRTIGKAAFKLKVVKPDGSKVSIIRAFGRSLAYILNYCTVGLSFLAIAFTPKKRGLHDYVADTIVIKK